MSDSLFATSKVSPILVKDGRVLLLDQRKIPALVEYFDATELDEMISAIKDMVVRGAPAIGVAAAIGLAFEARRLSDSGKANSDFWQALSAAKERLQQSRPTAVNIQWATEALFQAAQDDSGDVDAISKRLVDLSLAMIESDIAANKRIGEFGQGLIPDAARVLTHCNAGALATCGWGTALGVVRSAHASGKRLLVYADETRPRQQGSRLTVWELMQDGIDTVLIADTMAGHLMSKGEIDLVIVGADRIATNGDAANKIGTYTLAVLASAHNIPFYVAAPMSTVDPAMKTGKEIPIEQRDPVEVTTVNGVLVCPSGTKVTNPAFDVTPARLITAIITDAGVFHAPYEESLGEAVRKSQSMPLAGILNT